MTENAIEALENFRDYLADTFGEEFDVDREERRFVDYNDVERPDEEFFFGTPDHIFQAFPAAD